MGTGFFRRNNMRSTTEEKGRVQPKNEDARREGLAQAIARWRREVRRYMVRRRIRWEITAARLDDQTKRNLAKWARFMVAAEPEESRRALVLVVLQEETTDVVVSMDELIRGHWTGR
jgi:hypothetical protein